MATMKVLLLVCLLVLSLVVDLANGLTTRKRRSRDRFDIIYESKETGTDSFQSELAHSRGGGGGGGGGTEGKEQKRGERRRDLQAQCGKGYSSFCGKAGKGKGNPPSLDPICVEDDGSMCMGCGNIVTGVQFLQEFEIPSDTTFEGVEVGGISGITFDEDRGVYYLLSVDDANEQQRFFEATIDPLSGEVEILDARMFRRRRGSLISGDFHPQGIVYRSPGTLIVSSIDPVGLFEFDLAGTLLRYFNVPDNYFTNSDETFGARPELGLASATLSPMGDSVWTATEQALNQDGPTSTDTGLSSPARILKLDPITGQPIEEYVYYTNPGFGLTAFVALDDCGQSFLALESSGSSCLLTEFNTCFATDVFEQETIIGINQTTFSEPFPVDQAVQKTILVDFEALLLPQGNCEGISFSRTGTGAASVLIASDNEFMGEGTQMLFLSLSGGFERTLSPSVAPPTPPPTFPPVGKGKGYW